MSVAVGGLVDVTLKVSVVMGQRYDCVDGALVTVVVEVIVEVIVIVVSGATIGGRAQSQYGTGRVANGHMVEGQNWQVPVGLPSMSNPSGPH